MIYYSRVFFQFFDGSVKKVYILLIMYNVKGRKFVSLL